MAYKLHVDLLSQPSRAIYILMKKEGIDFETKIVDLKTGEQYSEDFTKNVSRFQKVPVIDHNGFKLTESVAIVQYLARNNAISESLYPKEIKLQARVDEFMSWQAAGLRIPLITYFRVSFLEPLFTGKPADESVVAENKTKVETALTEFDTKWLGRGNVFVTGDKVTVADLWASCELEQLRIVGYDPKAKYPNIAAWWDKVREFYNPYYNEAHEYLEQLVASNAKGAK